VLQAVLKQKVFVYEEGEKRRSGGGGRASCESIGRIVKMSTGE
jgi:hypothetical protein